jgi:tRNA uridine 5-carboxymethylaminomethyl modification enzyme
VDQKRWIKFQNKQRAIAKLKSYLQETRSQGVSLWEQLRQPNNTVASRIPSILSRIWANGPGDIYPGDDVSEAVIIDAKYEGYLSKQKRLVANFRALENRKISLDLDYNSIEHLRTEAKEKLSAFRPSTLAQASRISGVTPADITVLQIYLKKMHRK